jgi:hypothetical protein
LRLSKAQPDVPLAPPERRFKNTQHHHGEVNSADNNALSFRRHSIILPSPTSNTATKHSHGTTGSPLCRKHRLLSHHDEINYGISAPFVSSSSLVNEETVVESPSSRLSDYALIHLEESAAHASLTGGEGESELHILSQNSTQSAVNQPKTAGVSTRDTTEWFKWREWGMWWRRMVSLQSTTHL